jgi:hypothetical protein
MSIKYLLANSDAVCSKSGKILLGCMCRLGSCIWLTRCAMKFGFWTISSVTGIIFVYVVGLNFILLCWRKRDPKTWLYFCISIIYTACQVFSQSLPNNCIY